MIAPLFLGLGNVVEALFSQDDERRICLAAGTDFQ